MTPKTSLVTVVAVALVSVPAAWGNGWASTASPDAFERAVAAQHHSVPIVSPDAVDRAVAAKLAQATPIVSPDAVDRMKAFAAQSRPITSPDAVDRALAARADYGTQRVFDDRFREPVDVPVATSPISSGRDLEWSQIGMGFGLGILLALGLFLAMRYTRIRQPAH